jgi:hypothetical protein
MITIFNDNGQGDEHNSELIRGHMFFYVYDMQVQIHTIAPPIPNDVLQLQAKRNCELITKNHLRLIQGVFNQSIIKELN